MNVAIGDVHGCLDQLLSLLEREGLIDVWHQWAGGDAHLIFLGDYVDRGPDGIGVIETIMRMETEAREAGGLVTALLGNHDVMLLEMHCFRELLSSGCSREGREISLRTWLENIGGQQSDLERLEPHHVTWLAQRPAMLKVDETLLIHADNTFYLEYGDSIEAINSQIRDLLERPEIGAIDTLEERFASRMAFTHEPGEVAREFAARFGAKRIVHGHTPIRKLLRCAGSEVIEPLEYANGICINLDHGLCYGGQGFVYQF